MTCEAHFESFDTTSYPLSAGDHTISVDYPAVVDAGDAIIVVISRYIRAGGPSGFSGWGFFGTGGGDAEAGARVKIADGSEGGTSMTWNVSSDGVSDTVAAVARYSADNGFSFVSGLFTDGPDE